MKDYIDQLLEAPPGLETPYNLDRDYFDPRKFNEIAVSYKAQLERAMITDDGFEFDRIKSEAEHFADMIYDTFFDSTSLSPSDLVDNKVRLNEVRLKYGNFFTNKLTSPTRNYLTSPSQQ